MKVLNQENDPLDHTHAPPLKISLSLYTVKKPSRRDPTEILSISSRYPTLNQAHLNNSLSWLQKKKDILIYDFININAIQLFCMTIYCQYNNYFTIYEIA